MSEILVATVGHFCWAVVLAMALALPAAGHAQDADVDQPPYSSAEKPGYRRVFVPSERPEQWPTEGDRYLPIDRQEFDRLIQAAADRRELAKVGAAQISRATYLAELEDDGSLTGSARFEVQLIDKSPQILPLPSWKLVLHNARWQGGAASDDAQLGAWKRPGQQAAEHGIFVERPGDLEIQWSLPQGIESADQLQFHLQLPPALEQEFAIELAAGYAASLSSAILESQTPTEDGSQTRWTFRLGAVAEHILRIRRPPGTSSIDSQAPLVAATDAYNVTPSGLQCESRYRIQLRASTQPELRLVVPDELRITEVLVAEKPAIWRKDAQSPRTVLVEMPQTDSPFDVTVRAAGRVTLNEPWKLPRIIAQGVFQTEGATTLWVDAALELLSITPQSSVMVNQVGIGRSAGGEAYRLQSWSSDATTEVVIAPRRAKLQARAVVVAEFADRELAGRCEARLWAEGAPLLHIDAAVEPQWNLESVEARPAESLVQWHLVGEGPQRRLHLQLRRSPTEAEPIALSISARKPLRGWAPVATLGELDWIHFEEADRNSSPLLVADRQGGELSASRDAMEAVRPLELLSPLERELFGNDVRGLLFAAKAAPRSATIRVAAAPARFQGQAWIELAQTDTGFKHSAELLCRPTAGSISELTVAAARRLPADAQWSIVGSSEPVIVELVNPANADDGVTGAAEYRIRLARPRSDDFRLRVTWRSDQQTADSIVPLVMPAAESWQSWAILRGRPTAVEVDPNGCAPAAAAPSDASDGAPVIGCYRLGDDPSASLAAAPKLSLRQSPVVSEGAGVTCWDCDISTLQFADGNQSHRIVYELELQMPQTVTVQAPAGVRIVSARVDNEMVPLSSESAGAPQVRLSLPGPRKRVRVTVDLHGRTEPLDSRTRVFPVLPKTAFTPLRGRWTVSSPSPYVIDSPTASNVAAGLRRRLFGPLVDPSAGQASPIFGLGAALGPSSETIGGPRTAANATGGLAAPEHWSTASQAFVKAPTPIEIRRLDDSRAAWHAIWLTSAVVAAIAWPSRSRWILAAAALAALACLTLPVTAIVVPQAILLGVAAGALMRHILLKAAPPPPAMVGLRSAAALGACLLTTMAGSYSSIQAAEGVAVPPAVLYPIDDKGQPTGTDVYAPASLLNQLLPAASNARHAGAEWHLQNLRFQLELSEDSSSRAVECTGGTLRFRVHTFRPDVEVELPLVRSDADWGETQTADGTPLTLQWNQQTTGCSVRMAQPGVHDVVIKLRPNSRRNGAEMASSRQAPASLDAVVEVNHPAGLDFLKINSVTVIPDASTPTKTITRIAPTEQIKVSWPAKRTSTHNGVTVDTLSQLHIEPTSARLQVDLRLTGEARALDTLELATPPQLKLLPLPEDSPVAEAQSISGLPSMTVLKLRGPLQLPRVIRLQFQVQRSVSLGRIDFPFVRALGVTPGAAHFAVTVDPRLRLRSEATTNLTSTPVVELEQIWGAFEANPTAQFAAAGGEPEWTMQIEPVPPQLTTRESMELLCSAADAQVTYAAAVDVVQGDVLFHQLSVPADLEVIALTVDSGDAEADLRWARPRPDRLFVFLARPLKAPYRLRLTGRLVHDSQKCMVPRIEFEGNSAAPIMVDVLRASDVLVQWSDDADTPPPATGSLDHADGLLVGRYAIDRGVAKMPALRISPNEARISAGALLSLNLEDAEPIATAALHIRALRGVVDHVRLQIGRNWQAPLVADSGVKVITALASSNSERQVVELHLAKPLVAGREATLRISGAVAFDSDRRLRFPHVRLLDATDQRVFLVLPRTPSDQTAEWTLRGLQRARLPDALAGALDQSPAAATYRVERDRFIAEQRVFPLDLRNALVRLAETQVVLDDGGAWSAIAQLIVQPGGASSFEIELPEGTELIHAAVDERPIPFMPTRRQRLEVPVGPRYLPRSISIAFRRSNDNARRLQLETPHVLINGKKIRIARSLWRLEGELPGRSLIEGEGAAISPVDFDATRRREQLAAVLEASPLAFQLPQWERDEWLKPWVRRIDSTTATTAASVNNEHEAAWENLRERIELADQSTATTAASQLDAEQATASYRGGPDGALTLTPSRSGLGAGRWLLALAIAAVGIVAWRTPEKLQPIVEVVRRWPAALGVLAGLAWWMWLTPALLGMAIVALSLAAFIKTRQLQRQRSGQERSQSEYSTTATPVA